jgi:hypothetical protein
MAPLPNALLSLLPRSFLADANDVPTINSDTRSLSPMAVQALHLAKRDGPVANFGAGTTKPDAFNNAGIQALFALIGMGMVLLAIWFFFWAKNGGFKFQEGDWEDYKSTVLRRKGPDGKTLSNATKSTRLGGGSVVHGGSYGAESSVGYTDETGTSADFSEMREVEEGHGVGLRGGEAKKKRTRRDHTNDYKDQDLRGYRSEKPARVGGLNRQADGVYTDFSNTGSDLGSNVSSKPLVTVTAKDKKKEAKAKEMRARERMRQAKLIEKNAAKTAAAEEKARKAAEKEQAKREKAEQKKMKKTRRTDTEYTPTEAPMTEVAYTEVPKAEMSEIAGPSAARRAPPSAAYSFVTGDDTNTVYTGAYTERDAPDDTKTVYTGVYTDNRTAPSEAAESSYYSDYRPNADPTAFSDKTRSRRDRQSQSHSRTQSRQSSPRKNREHRSSRHTAAPSDIFTQANGDVQGTIAYPCYIPGLSQAGSVGVSESVSQVGGPSSGGRRGRDVMDGYRRGGVRSRRDSLSDSDS